MPRKAGARLQVRVNQEVKDEAVIVLESIGMDLTSAINLFLKQVIVTRSIPFKPVASSEREQIVDEAIRAPRMHFDRCEDAEEYIRNL
ncbi:type II toxin-antitoxin system RelB/DinJ family antitoxin [Alloscardovia venturai]|uniref:Type II toxin-antitoxin system RelB/DinJ family antitoxin n=1 Tax=Alloscardovia venturai TaxID=1769421 RepID=A0ABW2Y1X5_9BIFI